MFPAIDVTKLSTLLQEKITNDVGLNTAYGTSQTKVLLTSLQTAPYPMGAAVQALLDGLPVAEKTSFSSLIKFVREFYPGVDEEVAGRVTYRGFKFRTNGTALLSRAKESWALMGKLTATMQRYLGHVSDPSLSEFGGHDGASSAERDKANKLFVRWFDKTRSHVNISEVRRIVTNLNKAVTAEDFEIICEGDPTDPHGLCYPNPIAPGEFGEVRKGDGRNRFYLGPIFFNELEQQIGGTCSLSVAPRVAQTYAQAKNAIFTALNASTITMLHELTHITSIGNTNDEAPNPYSVTECEKKAKNSPTVAVRNAENYALFAKDILNAIQFSPPAAVRI